MTQLAPAHRELIEHRPPLGAHRLLGYGAGSALIRPDGEIDWWCRDRFDAAPLLWSLLDRAGGSSTWLHATIAQWDHHPAGPTAHSVIHVGSRRVRLWDGLLADDDTNALVRLARVEAGPPFELTHRIIAGGFDASWQTWTLRHGTAISEQLAICGHRSAAIHGHELHSTVDVTADGWSGIVVLEVSSPLVAFDIDAWVARMREAEREEERFLDNIRLPRDHPSRVIDALRVLRVLTDRTSGAPIASPTTSLPEAPGGSRQYDYRYAWLRDAAYAVATAALLGRTQAATAYLEFVGLLLDRYGSDLPSLTTTEGGPVPKERDIDGVAGWANSQPVRTGNAASTQRQLDSPATVLDAIHTHLGCGGRMTAATWGIVDRLATMLATAPFQPTSGIWEIREPQLLVTDELARWIGLDKAERMRRRHRPWIRRRQWTTARDAAWARVNATLDPNTGMLPQSFEGPAIADAATLLAAIHGFYPRRSEQARRLVRATVSLLEEGPFLRRHPIDDTDPDTIEGAFIPVSWWAVTALATIGDLDAARQRADEMCLHLPPLLAEEWSVEQDEALGNTPLLWSHTEAARALHHLHQERLRHRYGTFGLTIWRIVRHLRLRLAAVIPDGCTRIRQGAVRRPRHRS